MKLEIIIPPVAGQGESPVWDTAGDFLYWIDNSCSSIFRNRQDGRELSVWSFPGRATALACRASGGLLVSSRTTLCGFDLDSLETDVLFDAECGEGLVFNDAKADRQGRLIAGLVERALIAPAARGLIGRYETAGRLFQLGTDGTASQLALRIGITNGPCFSPDGSTFYCGDSWSRQIWSFDYDPVTGEASKRRQFAAVDDGESVPDGATIDEEGFLWVATYEGREIRRYAPDGSLDRSLPLPVTPTSLMFGGTGLDILFVTTSGGAAVAGRAASGDRLGGSLLAVHGLGVRGVPEVMVAA